MVSLVLRDLSFGVTQSVSAFGLLKHTIFYAALRIVLFIALKYTAGFLKRSSRNQHVSKTVKEEEDLYGAKISCPKVYLNGKHNGDIMKLFYVI